MISIITYIVITVLFCLIPAVVLWLCRRLPLLGKIGPIMTLYAIGIVIANIPNLPAELKTIQDVLPNVMIPLAIPMMLFSCNFTLGELRMQLKVVISGFLSVALAVSGGYLLFGYKLTEGTEIGGIISGMYSGGTLNAAALQTIFGVNGETFVLINSYDIIISFLYFVFLFSCGIKLFRKLYGEKHSTKEEISTEQEKRDTPSNPYSGLWSKAGMKELGKIVGATLCIVVLSAVSTLPFPSEWFMVIFILMLTTLGVAGSFIKPLRKLNRSYDIGMYLIYIFSLAIATMADFSNIDITQGLIQIAFMSFAVFVSLTIHAIFCRLLRVDADSMVISSVAFINSPPFVPMVVAAMRNKGALVVGLGAGIVGYALGNHFGVLMSKLLEIL